MTSIFVCEGAPRDQGTIQGSRYRCEIRDWSARLGSDPRRRLLSAIRPLTAGPVLGTGVGREVLRHHPHIAERMDGIARGAGLPLSALMEMILPGRDQPAHSGPSPCHAEAQLALPSAEAGGGIARALPAHVAPGNRFVVRRSEPEIGFRSVELTLPWQASCLAGVNDQGLAIAIVPQPDARPPYSFAPPAILLVQDCLQRFVDIESTLEWCMGRPAAPGVAIAVADAKGGSAAVVLSPDGHRVLRGGDSEPVVCGADAQANAALRKTLAAGSAPLQALQQRGVGAVALDPVSRRLAVRFAGAELVFGVTADDDGKIPKETD